MKRLRLSLSLTHTKMGRLGSPLEVCLPNGIFWSATAYQWPFRNSELSYILTVHASGKLSPQQQLMDACNKELCSWTSIKVNPITCVSVCATTA